jgi:hypothetical protein
MSTITNAGALHKKAASEHEAVAKHHLKAAECHDQNKLNEADKCSKSAMEGSTMAHKHSADACQHSTHKQQ